MDRISASPNLGLHVARIRRVTLASGRVIWTGYDDLGRQIIAVAPAQEPDALDLHLRESPSSIAQEEDRRARRARKRSLAGIKADIRNVSHDDVPAPAGRPLSRAAAKEARAKETLSKLSPLPEGGDDLDGL